MRNELPMEFDFARWKLDPADRLLRLALEAPEGPVDALVVPQRMVGTESICGGFRYNILGVADNARLELKDFIGRAAEIQIVTDRRQVKRICGIVTAAAAGQTDGALATYELTVCDALALMEERTSTRVFRNKSELDIVELLVDEWRQANPALGTSFAVSVKAGVLHGRPPQREFIMQYNESDASFIRRLLQRRGIAWYFQSGMPGSGDKAGQRPVNGHTLVLFDDPGDLQRNGAGSVRFHRDAATEERDAIDGWSAIRTLQRGSVTVHSWDYKAPVYSERIKPQAFNTSGQGKYGTQMAAGLDDYRVLSPHAGDDPDDLQHLGKLMMNHHQYQAKCFHGEGGVRELAVGEWFDFVGHPDIDTHPANERQFVVTEQRIAACNNVPVAITERVERLFNRNGWDVGDYAVFSDDALKQTGYRTRFSCVRRGIPIVPPPPEPMHPNLLSAIVVGPDGEEIWCDDLARVQVRFPAARSGEDSAWVRVLSSWAGNGCGPVAQSGMRMLPLVGSEVMIDFAGGDPDKPVVIGQVFNSATPPPAFRREGALPHTRFQSGVRSREVGGVRGNQLRLDDTPNQISAQLGSDHAAAELNLGYLTEARREGAARARGEGAELRTEESIALHAARGILLSAWKMLGGESGKGRQLARDELLGLLRECSEMCAALGDAAAENNGLPADLQEQKELLARIERWEDGSNTAPQATERVEPIVAVSASAGISFASSASIVGYAARNIDVAGQQHLQFSAGQCVSVNAGKGMGLFALGGGFKAIAHQGKLLLQSQHDDTDIDSAKDLKLSAGNGTATISAKVILLVAEDGSFLKLGDGPPVMGSKQQLKFHAPDYVFDEPQSMTAHFPNFGSGRADQQFEVRYASGIPDETGTRPPGAAVDDARMKVSISDGSGAMRMSSDADGRSALLKRDAMHIADVSLLRGGDQ